MNLSRGLIKRGHPTDLPLRHVAICSPVSLPCCATTKATLIRQQKDGTDSLQKHAVHKNPYFIKSPAVLFHSIIESKDNVKLLSLYPASPWFQLDMTMDAVSP